MAGDATAHRRAQRPRARRARLPARQLQQLPQRLRSAAAARAALRLSAGVGWRPAGHRDDARRGEPVHATRRVDARRPRTASAIRTRPPARRHRCVDADAAVRPSPRRSHGAELDRGLGHSRPRLDQCSHSQPDHCKETMTMKSSTRILTFSVISALITGTAAFALAPRPDQRTPVERGKYLVTAMGCNDCHTPWKMGPDGPAPDMSRMLSGHPAQMAMPAAPAATPEWPTAVSGT